MLIGEQAGDREDIEGLPFVGPAGRLLDQALDEAGIDREALYVTNVIKHFKFELRGKRLRGSWVLVRTRRSGRKNQWLLIKHRDERADPDVDPVEKYRTSVTTGRTMAQIAAGTKPRRRRR